MGTIDHTGQTLRPLPNFCTNFNHLKCLRYLKTRPKEVYHYALKYTKTVFVGWLVCWETGADAKRERGGVGSIAGHVRIPSCLQGRVLVSCKQALPPVKDGPRLELGYKDSRVL